MPNFLVQHVSFNFNRNNLDKNFDPDSNLFDKCMEHFMARWFPKKWENLAAFINKLFQQFIY